MLTREELWNGNREPLSSLWSLNPERSVFAWAATRYRVYRRRDGEAASTGWERLHFVRLRTQGRADGFLAGVEAAASRGSDDGS